MLLNRYVTKTNAACGTASVFGGGKFANGALTGAFHHLLNAEAGRRPAPGTVDANDDGGPDPLAEGAFSYGTQKGYLSTNEAGDLQINSSFVYVGFYPDQVKSTNAYGSPGQLVWFDKGVGMTMLPIHSGGQASSAQVPRLVDTNTRIPSGNWAIYTYKEPVPPYINTSNSGGFWNHGISFKIGISTPGTGRGGILFHPSPSVTEGCVGLRCGPQELLSFRDRMFSLNGKYPLLHVN